MKTAQKARVNIQRVRKVQRVPAWSVLNRNLIDNDSSTQDSKDSGVYATEPLRNDSMDDIINQEDSGKRDVHPLRTESDGDTKTDKDEDSVKEDNKPLGADSNDDEDAETEQSEDFRAVLEFTLSSCICGMEEIPKCDFVMAGNDGIRDNGNDAKNAGDTKISEMARHNSKTKEESKSPS